MRGKKLTKEDCIRKIEKLKLKEAFEESDFNQHEIADDNCYNESTCDENNSE